MVANFSVARLCFWFCESGRRPRQSRGHCNARRVENSSSAASIANVKVIQLVMYFEGVIGNE